jgi:CubicO group peptidase (beta-lactamase class C family)
MMRRGMRSLLGEVWTIPNWAKSIQRIEATTPWYTPGSVPAYQFFSYGFLCGELVHRITGKTIQEFFDENFARPLGLAAGYPSAPAARPRPARHRGDFSHRNERGPPNLLRALKHAPSLPGRPLGV